LPLIENVTPPAETEAPVGFAKEEVAEAVNAAPTAKARVRRTGRSRANAPFSRRNTGARERRELLTYPPDPPLVFATAKSLGCYPPPLLGLRNYITLRILRARSKKSFARASYFADFAAELSVENDSCC
jgi:hypothetical protein